MRSPQRFIWTGIWTCHTMSHTVGDLADYSMVLGRNGSQDEPRHASSSALAPRVIEGDWRGVGDPQRKWKSRRQAVQSRHRDEMAQAG